MGQLEDDANASLEFWAAHHKEDPDDIARYHTYRKAALTAGRYDLAGLIEGDRVQVKVSENDIWISEWFGRINLIQGPDYRIEVENNLIQLKSGYEIDSRGYWMKADRITLVEPFRGI